MNIWLDGLSKQLRNASRRALHLWKGRDAAHVAFGGGGRPRDGSEASSYAQTLIGGSRHRSDPSDPYILCSGCSRVVLSAFPIEYLAD